MRINPQRTEVEVGVYATLSTFKSRDGIALAAVMGFYGQQYAREGFAELKKKSRGEVSDVQKSSNNPKDSEDLRMSEVLKPVGVGPNSVVSFNQQGGITAATVNITEEFVPLQERILTAEAKQAIQFTIADWPRLKVVVIRGNSREGQAYSKQFEELFEKAGWEVQHFLPATSFRKESPMIFGMREGLDDVPARELSQVFSRFGIPHKVSAFSSKGAREDMLFDVGIIDAKPLQAIADKIN